MSQSLLVGDIIKYGELSRQIYQITRVGGINTTGELIDLDLVSLDNKIPVGIHWFYIECIIIISSKDKPRKRHRLTTIFQD